MDENNDGENLMAKTASNMIPLGTLAPDFELPDVISGELKNLTHLKSNIATVIFFICNHCPFVKHIQPALVEVTNRYLKKDISFIAINSNDIDKFPEDSPENMKKEAEKWGYSFPYLFDADQSVAKSYHAACTPDFYIFDKNSKCVYRGQFDDARPGNGIAVTGEDVTQALDNLLQGKLPNLCQKPSIGCNIKWK